MKQSFVMPTYLNKNQIRISKGKMMEIILALFSIFLFFSFIYPDLLITTKHGMNFWNCLFYGNISDFYSYNNGVKINTFAFPNGITCGAYYDIMMYIIFAFWNLPMWVLETYFNVDVFHSLICLMYIKSILIFFSMGILFFMKKIGKLINYNDEQISMMQILFFTSGIFISSVTIISHYDVIPLLFIMGGTYFFIKGNKKLFLLCFAVAAPLKLFSMFFFVALLLYSERNIVKILGKILIVLIPLTLMRYLVPFYELSNDIEIPIVFFSNSWDVSIGSVPICIILLTIVYLLVYFHQPADNPVQFGNEIIYMGFLVYGVFFISCLANPYWIIYILPFMCFVVVNRNMQYLGVNIFLEMLVSFSYSMAGVFKAPHCFGNQVVGDMIIPYIIGKVGVNYDIRTVNTYSEKITNVVEWLTPENLKNIWTGFFVAALIVMIILNNPLFDMEKYGVIKSINKENELFIYRIVMGILVCAIPITLYLVSIY